jgi:hypothetical protein
VSEVVVATVVVAIASEAAALSDANPPPLSQAVSSRAGAESATARELAVSSRTINVLRLSRPVDKYLADPLETTAASEELRKRCRRQPAHRDESKEGKNRLALPHLHLWNLPHEACVPTKRRPLVLRWVTISEEQGELERFNESDDLDLRSRG